MMTPTEVGRQWFERVWNQKDESAFAELMSPAVVGITETGTIAGPDEFVQKVFKPFVAAFPDIQATITGTVAQDDEVIVRWTAIGTQSGAMAGIAATGLRVSFSGMSWFRVKDGVIVEGQDAYNLHAVITCLSTRAETGGVKILA